MFEKKNNASKDLLGDAFNGRTFIKNRAITGNFKNHKINKKSEFNINEVSKIIVEATFVDVFVTNSKKADKVKVNLHGRIKIEGDIDYDVSLKDSILRIFVDYNGFCNYKEDEFKLEIIVPEKIFEKISVRTYSTNIYISDITAKTVSMRSIDGNMIILTATNNITAVAETGYINTSITPLSKNLNADICTISGDIAIKLNEITQLHIIADANIRETIKNTYTPTEHANDAFLDLTTETGTITIS